MMQKRKALHGSAAFVNTLFVLFPFFCDIIFPIGLEGIHMLIHEGDTVQMKKKHPCGGDTFLVLRTGIDFKIRCMSCGHEIRLPRAKFEKGLKRITEQTETEE